MALGNRTALELAVAGKSLEVWGFQENFSIDQICWSIYISFKFMSLDGVQEKLQMIWNGENIKTKDEPRNDQRFI